MKHLWVILFATRVLGADLSMTIEREHVLLDKPVTLTVQGAAESIRLERAGGTVGRPMLIANRLDGSCKHGAKDATGCDELRVDFESGQLEFRSFARRKGIRAQLDGLDAVWETAPLRITSRSRTLNLTITSAASGKLRFAAAVNKENFSRTVENRGRTYPASIAPLLLLFHDVMGSDRVVRSKEVGTTEPPPPSGGGSGSSCSICDFCQSLPGGSTLGGCLGDGGILGGPGGGGIRKPKSCTITVDEALRVFADVLRF